MHASRLFIVFTLLFRVCACLFYATCNKRTSFSICPCHRAVGHTPPVQHIVPEPCFWYGIQRGPPTTAYNPHRAALFCSTSHRTTAWESSPRRSGIYSKCPYSNRVIRTSQGIQLHHLRRRSPDSSWYRTISCSSNLLHSSCPVFSPRPFHCTWILSFTLCTHDL